MNPDAVPIGAIHITYSLGDDGDTYVSHTVEGEIPLIIGLGMLDMTRDEMLHPDEDDA